MLSSEDEFPSEYAELYGAFGTTMARWSGLEHSFVDLFARLTGMEHRMAHAVFFSGRNFVTRADLIRGAIDATTAHSEIAEFAKGALKRALQYSAFRNALAHGVLTVVPHIGSPLDGQPVVMESTGFRLMEDAPTTITDMRNAATNFTAFTVLVQHAASWDETEPEQAPHKYLELVRELPNPPQSRPISRMFQERALPLLASRMAGEAQPSEE